MKKTKVKFLSIITLISILLLSLSSCGPKKSVDNSAADKETKSSNAASNNDSGKATAPINTSGKNPIATIEMEDGAKIKIELYPNIAPNTVKNFISLAQKRFYDGLVFHRVIPDFMIQGGDPEGTGEGGPGYSIKGEFKANRFTNDLKHERGVISMARTDEPDTAGSQFFIMVASAPHLDGYYAAFGKVIEGMDEVDKIVKVQRNENDRPLNPPKMKHVTVDTFGVKYDEPEKIK